MKYRKPYPECVGRRYVRRFGRILRFRPEYQVWPRFYNPLEWIERHGRLISATRQIARKLGQPIVSIP